MQYLEIILPIILLALAFISKLTVGRNVDIPVTIQAICELPVDMIFLSLSFSCAYTISKPIDPKGFIYTMVFIVFAFLVIFIWRKSLKLVEEKNKWWLLLLALNIFISLATIAESINVLLGKHSILEQLETKSESNGK